MVLNSTLRRRIHRRQPSRRASEIRILPTSTRSTRVRLMGLVAADFRAPFTNLIHENLRVPCTISYATPMLRCFAGSLGREASWNE